MSFDFSTLVTDRTQADVDRVKAIAKKIEKGTASESELAEFNSAAMKGAYNYTDLNRVTAAMDALKAKLEGYGYAVPGYQRIEVPHPSAGDGSRLPEGYTELAYIQSSGTQHVDTLFAPNQDTRVVMDAYMTAESLPSFFYGSRNSAFTVNYGLFVNSSGVRSTYNASTLTMSGASVYERAQIDQNKNVCSVNDVTVTNTAGTFQSDLNLFLFASNEAGTAKYFGFIRLYSCQIYDAAALIRDYVPCIDPSGEVGLYDLVTKAFFGNSGTGQFYGFVQPVLTSNGTLGGTSFAVYASNEHSATYAAYKAFGSNASEAYSSSVNPSITPIDYVIYNPDAIYLKSLNITNVPSGLTSSSPKNVVLYGSNDNSQWDALVTVANTNNTNGSTWEITSASKEMYKYFKLHITSSNTSEAYVNIGKIQLNAYVLADESTSNEETGKDQLDPYLWYEEDAPTTKQMTVYLLNVSAIRAVLAVMASTPEVPPDMAELMVQEANDIEVILLDVYRQINIMETTFIPSGEALCGGDNL